MKSQFYVVLYNDFDFDFDLLCLTPLERTATGKLYHLRLRVECTLFCNLQNQARTHAILVIGLYELLGNQTT